MSLWVVLPAYNEAPRLPALLARWRAVGERLGAAPRMVAVDDASTDGTADVLEAARQADPERFRVLTHPVNRGLGRTLADGMTLVAKEADAGDALVVMDADNTQPPELTPAMLERLDAGFDVVIASRFRRGSATRGLSLGRRLLSLGALAAYVGAYRVPGVRDYTCGYRALRVGTLQRALTAYGEAFFEREGFECQVDTLLKLHALGARFSEVPLELDYAQKQGHSHMQVGRTILRSLGLLLRRGRDLNSSR